jgi:hypothetical protein
VAILKLSSSVEEMFQLMNGNEVLEPIYTESVLKGSILTSEESSIILTPRKFPIPLPLTFVLYNSLSVFSSLFLESFTCIGVFVKVSIFAGYVNQNLNVQMKSAYEISLLILSQKSVQFWPPSYRILA